MRLLSGCVVVAFALFLAGLAVATFLWPAHARRFFNAFARSARTHYTEQALRLVVGSALVGFSSAMWQPDLFLQFGWVVIATTAGLLVIPWRWHQKVARRIVPPVLEHMKLLGVGALLMAALLLYGVLAGDAA
jgi:hypothetical protein